MIKKEHKYLIAMLPITAGCAILYFQRSIWLGLTLIASVNLFTNDWTKSTRIELSKIRPKNYFLLLSILCAAVVFTVLLFSHSREELKILFGKWYFTGAIWLFSASSYLGAFLEEREKKTEEQSTNTANK